LARIQNDRDGWQPQARKLVRRLGPEVVAELTRVAIGKAQRETRFGARAVRVVDRSRQLGRTVRAISRTLARRTGQRRDEVMQAERTGGPDPGPLDR
jgi:hypothetical protein